MVKETWELFQASANENADGKLIPSKMDSQQGFLCEDSDQTIEGKDRKIVYVYHQLS